jgi:hypothetical protein
VDLDTFIINVFCLIDDELRELRAAQPWRRRGPQPVLADSEVLTMELAGEFLGLDQDKALYRYFRQHYQPFFPNLGRVHRTTFVRQAANLWQVKQRLWQRLLPRIAHDPNLAILDSLPLPACRFARAPRCRRFRGEAAFGRDHVARQTFYGFRLHARLCWPGIITGFCLAPANVSEPATAPDLVAGSTGFVLGDRAYWSPRLREELRALGLCLLAPFRKRSRDPDRARSFHLSRIRYRIDTVFGQLSERYGVKRLWARDAWHLYNRLLRKILGHTVALFLNGQAGNPLLQLERLVNL